MCTAVKSRQNGGVLVRHDADDCGGGGGYDDDDDDDGNER